MNLELAVFFGVSFVILVSAVLVISAREIFHSALYLAVMFLSIAGLFVMLNAEFLAAIQILVYAGAVTVLILFAIMLTKREEAEEKAKIPILRGFVSLLFLLVMLLHVVRIDWWNYSPKAEAAGSVTAIGLLIFGDYVLPFEVISLLLLGAMIGALTLAKKEASE